MDEAAVLRYITETYPGTNPMQAAGDTFFLYDPDGDLPPERQQPYATLITGDRHDKISQLDRDGVYRLNVGVTRQTYRELFGAPPRDVARDAYGVLDTGLDYAVLDTLLPHPVYAAQNWVCVLAPSVATFETVVAPLLDEAYEFAVRKHTNQVARRDG